MLNTLKTYKVTLKPFRSPMFYTLTVLAQNEEVIKNHYENSCCIDFIAEIDIDDVYKIDCIIK